MLADRMRIGSIKTNKLPTLWDKKYLESGTFGLGLGTSELLPSSLGFNNTFGIKGIGIRNVAPGATTYINEYVRWEKVEDFTKINELRFHANKIVNHGMIRVDIVKESVATITSDNLFLQVHYGTSVANQWVEYAINTSSLTGKYKVIFIMGYIDSTGYATSETRYSNIRYGLV